MRRAINEPIKQQLMKAAASSNKTPHSPLLQNYVDQSPNRSGGVLHRVDRRRGCTSSCGGSGDESVLGDGECKSGDRGNVSSAVEDVSWHAGEKFSTLFWGGWFEATSEVISSVLTGHLGLGAKSEVDTFVSCPSRKCITEYVCFLSTRSTGSHKGSPLLRTWRCKSTGLRCSSHEGSAEPVMALRGNRKKRSWGVSFVERQTRDRTAWKASGNTAF